MTESIEEPIAEPTEASTDESTEAPSVANATSFGEGPVRVELIEDGAVSRTLRVEVAVEIVDKARQTILDELTGEANGDD